MKYKDFLNENYRIITSKKKCYYPSDKPIKLDNNPKSFIIGLYDIEPGTKITYNCEVQCNLIDRYDLIVEYMKRKKKWEDIEEQLMDEEIYTSNDIILGTIINEIKYYFPKAEGIFWNDNINSILVFEPLKHIKIIDTITLK